MNNEDVPKQQQRVLLHERRTNMDIQFVRLWCTVKGSTDGFMVGVLCLWVCGGLCNAGGSENPVVEIVLANCKP